MLREILKFNEPDFYQNINKTIKETIESYDKGKKDDSISIEDKAHLRSESESVLQNLMIDNGVTGDDDAYISMEKEFYTENAIDAVKIQEFQKRMLLNYTDQQIKWTFAGTTSLYSAVVRRDIENSGVDYNDMLPARLHREADGIRSSENINGDHQFDIFLYPDGTVSSGYISKKSRFSLDRLNDKSGFNWTSGYSPDNIISKKNWASGFNDHGEWQKMIVGAESAPGDAVTETVPLLGINELSKNRNSVGLYIFPDNEFVFLFDTELSLINGGREDFYSLTGELYGAREINTEKSIHSIKNYIKKNKVSKISGFVVNKVDEGIVDLYKKKFAELVDERTVFYDRDDQLIQERISDIQISAQNKGISDRLVAGFVSLTHQGIRGEELSNALAPSLVRKEYDVNLNIFGSEAEFNKFAALPFMRETADNDVVSYLKNTPVPVSKRIAYSNTVQNIVHNYNELFKHSDMSLLSVLKAAHEVVVDDNKASKKEYKSKTIVAERKLADFLKESISPAGMTGISYFRRAIKNEGDYRNIFDPDEFSEWAQGFPIIRNIPADSAREIVGIIKNSAISPEVKRQYIEIINRASMNPEDGLAQSIPTEEVSDLVRIKEIIFHSNNEQHVKRFLDETVDYLSGTTDATKTASYEQEYNARGSSGLDARAELSDVIEKSAFSRKEKKRLGGIIQTLFRAKYEGSTGGTNETETPHVTTPLIVSPETVTSLIKAISESSIPNDLKGRYMDEVSQSLPVNKHKDQLSGALIAMEMTPETIHSIWKSLSRINASERIKKAFSTGLQNSFAEYRSIRLSTSIAPMELFSFVEKTINNDIIDDGLANKRVFFDMNLTQFLEEAAKDNPNRVTVVKDDVFLAEKVEKEYGTLDLMSDRDINIFAVSPVMMNSGIPETDRGEIINFIKSARVPAGKSRDFTRGVSNVIKLYEDTIKPLGMSALTAIQSLVMVLNGEKEKVPIELSTILSTGIYDPDRVSYVMTPETIRDMEKAVEEEFAELYKLDLTSKADINNFITSPFFIQTGLSESDGNVISRMLRNSGVLPERAPKFTHGIIQTIKSYNKLIAPFGVGPVEAIKHAINAMAGDRKSVPEELLGVLDAIQDKKGTSISLGNADFDVPLAAFPIKGINLLDTQDYAYFINSPLFKKSGLSQEQLNTAIEQYKQAYSVTNERYYKTMPHQFRSIDVEKKDEAFIDIRDIAKSPINGHEELENNAGWIVVHSGAGPSKLKFTNYGNRYLDMVSKDFVINRIGGKGIAKNTPRSTVVSSLTRNLPEGEMISHPSGSIGNTDKQYVFSLPYPLTRKSSSIMNADFERGGAGVHAPIRQNHLSETLQSPQSVPQSVPESVPERIQQNYLADVQQLARSNKYNEPVFPGTQGAHDDENKIKKSIDDLFNEFVDKIESDF